MGELGYRVGLSGKKHVSPAESFEFEDVPGVPNPRRPTPEPVFDTSAIEEFMTRDPDQPFFLAAAFHEAHAPWTAGRPELIDQEKLRLPPNIADTAKTREFFTAYLAEIVVLDSEVGRLMDLLDRTGLADDTIVLFTSEQGSAYPGNKWTNWNTGVHTAMIVRWPGRIPAGERTDAIVQYADVLPTLVDAAGGDASGFDGLSFLPVLRAQGPGARRFAYFMHNNVPEGPPYPIRGLTDGVWHYIRNLTPERLYIEKHMMGSVSREWFWESWLAEAGPNGDEPINRRVVELVNRYMNRPPEHLYRVEGDPYQMRNLIGDPDLAAVRDRLAAELGRWMSSQGDPGAALDTEEQWRSSVAGEHGFPAR